MQKNTPYRIKFIVPCLMLALWMVTGCTSVPLDQIGLFAHAGADLAGNAADAYVSVNESAVERRIHDIASDSTLSPDEKTFQSLLQDKHMKARLDLLKGVEAYSQALGELAAADFREEIDQASLELYGALGKLKTTYDENAGEKLPLTEKSLSIMAASINAIGSVIIEKKRRDALKTVISEADPAIQKSMALTVREFQMFKDFFSMNLDAVWTDKIKAYQREAGTLTYDQRVRRLYSIRKAYINAKISPHIIAALSEAGEKVASAHAALREAVKNDEFTSRKLIREVRNIAALSKKIKDFQDTLETE